MSQPNSHLDRAPHCCHVLSKASFKDLVLGHDEVPCQVFAKLELAKLLQEVRISAEPFFMGHLGIDHSHKKDGNGKRHVTPV